MHRLSMIASLHPMTADVYHMHTTLIAPQPYILSSSSLSIPSSTMPRHQHSRLTFVDQTVVRIMRARKHTKTASKFRDG